jgi:prolyl-tRNA synthetase
MAQGQPSNKEKEEKKGITIKKEQDMAEWYEQVCLKSEIADFGPVKGTMIIRPNGYAIWQQIQDYFNENIIKPHKVRNAYFPLFIPESFFKKESKHAEGFSPEVAWLDPKLTGDEKVAVRPTSETIMYDAYSKWIRSHKDLPLRINQWCNVVRWETQATKLFLRSREFLWQEGHCVYETEKQCDQENVSIIKDYAKLCEDLLAIPVLIGKKTEKEKFAGAKSTYTIEGFMPDGKALQMGTAHNLGQGFAKAFNINFLGKDKKSHLPWQSSWGVSTRLIGGLIMSHSDNKGLVLPPNIAENKLAIVPIIIGKDSAKTNKVLKKAKELNKQLQEFNPIMDDRTEYSPGYKFNELELQGIPLRIEIGPRDLANNQIIIARRDTGDKQTLKINKNLNKEINTLLDNMQSSLLQAAKKRLKASIQTTSTWEDFQEAIKNNKLAYAHFCGNPRCEDNIKAKAKGASSRCYPLTSNNKPTKSGKCILCGKKSEGMIYFSRSY